MNRVIVVIAVIAAFALGFVLRGGGGSAASVTSAGTEDASAASVWTCSMHPQIQLPKAGQCPICFMDLIPLEEDQDDELGDRTLTMSAAAAALAEIRTTPVSRREVHAQVRLIGEIAYDETRYRTIAARVAGRIDTLLVDYTGTRVRQGEGLAALYSPELYTAQVELLNALSAERDLQNSSDPGLTASATATVVSARDRLRLWGLNRDQIAAVEARGSAREHVIVPSPLGGVVVHKNVVEGMYVAEGTPLFMVADLSRVWVALEAYESDLAWLAVGATVDFTVEALPGREFTGDIAFIDPVLDPDTRTVMVRLDAQNSDGILKPGMFVNAILAAGDPQNGDAEHSLVIPDTAPLITGERAVVYVRIPGHERPTFEGREIVLGPRVGDYYVVVSGLAEGELVVTRGSFKIDSALQIQAKPSMMNPEGGGPAPVHDHGQRSATAPGVKTGTTPAAIETPPVSDAFRRQLDAVLDAYVVMQEALVADDDAGAAAAAERAEAAVAGVDMSLAGDAHGVWMDDAARLRADFRVVAESKGIGARRNHLQSLTDALWNALRRYGYTDDRPVRLFHCPMAMDSQGADWIQRDAITANPYYGASMLRCGSQTDSLVVTAADGGR